MQIDIIGVPVDLGASRRGVDMGPAAIRYSGLREALLRMGLFCSDLGSIGARSLDDGEILLLRQFGVTVFTMEDIDTHDMHRVMRNALDVAESGTDALHASFDLDVVTPSEAPGGGTPVSLISSMLGKRIFLGMRENR